MEAEAGARERASKSRPAARVAVVIPAYNAEAHIIGVLERIRQTRLELALVIVVDDGSTDATKALVRAWDQEGSLSISWCGRKTVGTAPP